ncbi:MAG: ABC transporter ATP-binding protein/permease [Actinobacteria bacterium]|nr:ABC transporter ATP-binding protein/permease [Actinomycetota bacterium]MCA1719983.1 ABC transporter ATP-binding protein/permease [Actinomycetota bacterium]
MTIDVQAWRGVAAEGSEDLTADTTVRLKARSRALLRGLLRPHKRRLVLAALLLLAQNAAAMAGPYLVKVGIDRGIPPIRDGRGSGLLTAVSVALLTTAVLEYVTKRAFLVLSGRIGQAVLLDLRTRVYDHFQKLSVSFHEKYTSGRVISRLTSDVDAIAELLDGGLDDLVIAGLSVLSVGVILLTLDLQMGAVTLLSFPPLLWISAWFRRNSALAYRRTREAVALVIVHFVESLGGIRAVQAFRREPRNDQIFDVLNNDYRRANERAFKLVALFAPGIKLIGNATIALVLVFGALRVIDGAVEVGVLAAFLLYLRRFFEPMQDLSMFYNSLQSATAALEKLSGVLEEPPSVPEPSAPTPLRHAHGRLDLDGVRFGYRDAVVLPHLDLHVPAGQTVALVGATGAGKTTIARLLCRFYDPTEGAIRLDGVDLRDLSESDLRRAVVMVTQENFLFAGSIADNIRFGRPNATDTEVEAAARAIGAHDALAALPDGYATDVRKRGGRLSAGQRQLVAFARAFLADPAVLILDEATSSLDIPSERLVQRALQTVLAERTAVIIAHRLSTVEIADRVLVLDQGEVIEDGRPGQLLTESGSYARLQSAWTESLA